MREAASGSPPRRATLRDVAELAGVSLSTTSRALSGAGYAAADVRERVVAAAETLGYVPHAMARSLRRQDSETIGVLVSDLRNPFYAELAAGIADACRTAGYTMMLADVQNSADAEMDAARAFVATRVAGVILTAVSGDAVEFLLRQRVEVVEADRQFAEGRADAVVVDNAGAAQRITEHLIELGHRRIALVVDETTWTTGGARFEGFRGAFTRSGVDWDDSLVVRTGSDADEARRTAVDVLARRDRPTAIFAVNNLLAEGVWRAAGDLGLRIPGDLSMVSFDDSRWMSMVSPGITAVAQDSVDLGRAAVAALVDRLADRSRTPRTRVLEASVLARGSMAAHRRD